MKYRVEFEKRAIKDLKSIDKRQVILIMSWIENNLEGTNNPRKVGKALKGNLKDYWRYRIGQYRILVDINEKKLIILVISVGHRKNIYK